MIVTRQQMIQCELNSNLSEDELMEMAGRQCAYALMDEIRKENQVLILCGKGNNGGDGCVIADLLSKSGANVTVITPFGPPVTENAKYYYDNLKKILVDQEQIYVPTKDINTNDSQYPLE